MTETIAFYAVAPSQGKRSLSMATANFLASENHRTLYVELDTQHPSIATCFGISSEMQNVMEWIGKIQRTNDYMLGNYALTKRKLMEDCEDRKLKSIFKDLPENLDYLVLPKNFDVTLFPRIIDSEDANAEDTAKAFIQNMLFGLSTANYDYIVLNLPNELNHIFGYEVLTQSDHVVNVVTPSFTRLAENLETINIVKSYAGAALPNMVAVMNMVTDRIEASTYKEYLSFSEKSLLVPFEAERQVYEFGMEIKSPELTEASGRLLQKLGIEVEVAQKKKGLFGLGK